MALALPDASLLPKSTKLLVARGYGLAQGRQSLQAEEDPPPQLEA